MSMEKFSLSNWDKLKHSSISRAVGVLEREILFQSYSHKDKYSP